jgi:hypothetical protein
VRAAFSSILLAALSLGPGSAAAGRNSPPSPPVFHVPDRAAAEELVRIRTEIERAILELEPLIQKVEARPKDHADGKLSLERWAAERAGLVVPLGKKAERLAGLINEFDQRRENGETLRTFANLRLAAGVRNAARAEPDLPSGDEFMTLSNRARLIQRQAELAADEEEKAFREIAQAAAARRSVRRTTGWALLALAALVGVGVWALRRYASLRRPCAGAVLNKHYRLDRSLERKKTGYTRSPWRPGDDAFEAADLALDRKVIIESLRADEEDGSALLSGARSAAALKHPNLLEIYSFFQKDDRVFLVYEHFDSRPLSETLAGGRRFSPSEASTVLAQVSAAIEYAHAHGVARLDLSPERILLSPEGRVKLTGFALSSFKGSDRDALLALKTLLT